MFNVFVCASVFMYVCVCRRDDTFIRIMGVKPHSRGKDLHGSVCLLEQMK